MRSGFSAKGNSYKTPVVEVTLEFISRLNAPFKLGTPQEYSLLHFTSQSSHLEAMNVAAAVKIIDQLKANLCHGATAITLGSNNYDQSYSFST